MKKLPLLILSAMFLAIGPSFCADISEYEYTTLLSSKCTKLNGGLALRITETRNDRGISAEDLEYFLDNKELVIDEIPQAIDVEDASTLLPLIKDTKYNPIWTGVTTLIFGSAENFSNEQVRVFSSCLQKTFPNIQTLYLGYLDGKFQFSQNFLGGIGKPFQKVETLAVAGNGVNGETIGTLSKSFPKLKTLIIQSNLDGGAIKALEDFKNLEKLNLSRCGLSFSGDLSFPELPVLQNLNLSDNKIESTINFSQLSKLTHLNLSKNPIRAKYVIGLRHTSIKDLNLKDTSVYEHELMNHFDDVKTLEEINIANTLAAISPTFLSHPKAKFITK